jgi:hypothetical protein
MSEPRQSFHLAASPTRERVIDRIGAVLRGLPGDRAWRIEVHEHRPRRSDPQNRYLWGAVYPSILKAGGETLAGWTTDDLHEYLLGEHFGWETLSGFGRKRVRPLRRSSRLNKQEFADYVAFIQQRMAEHGIYVPDPNEYEVAA